MNKIAPAILAQANEEAVRSASFTLSLQQEQWVQTITLYAENQKAVLAALLTSLVKKIETPTQDVRNHKVELPGGYSGRSFDTAIITPFVRQLFPRFAMRSGSGWLTRSIEQLHPFNQDFPGRIQNNAVKEAFLNILQDIEENQQDPYPYLIATLSHLHNQHSASIVAFSSEFSSERVPIQRIVEALSAHFSASYVGTGASRLPVLALYAVYSLLMSTSQQYQGKRLLALKSHTTSDLKSASVGDIEVVREDGTFFEAVEVKHLIKITPTLVEDAYDKIRNLHLYRYYLLTTAEPNTAEPAKLTELCAMLLKQSDCEIIVNGVIPTLKYYLRLIPMPEQFIAKYSTILQTEFAEGADLKEVHIKEWQRLLEKY